MIKALKKLKIEGSYLNLIRAVYNKITLIGGKLKGSSIIRTMIRVSTYL
jgi:hypothetical protein